MKMSFFKNQSPAQDALANEPVRSLLLKMAGPSIVAMVMQALYNTVDSMYVSRISSGSMAAVTLAYPVQMIMGALSTGIGVGINSSISRSLGEKDQKKAAAAASNGLSLGLVTVAVMILFGIFGAEPFVRMYTTDPEVLAGGIIYVRTICFLSVGSVFSQLCFSVLQGSGSMVIPMLSQISGGIIVILLDPVLIFSMNLGILGAAIASSFAQIVSMLIGLYGIFKKNHENLPVTFRGFRPDIEIIKDIMTVGIPSALTQATTSIVAGIINKEIAVYGTDAVTLYGSFTKLNSFATLPVFGVTRGMNPILGFCTGEKNKDRFLETRNFAMVLANGWTFLAFLAFQLAPVTLLAMMNIKGDLVPEGITTYRVLSMSLMIMGNSIVMTQLFAPVKKSYISMISALLRQVVLLVPLTLYLGNIYGIHGIWIGIVCADFLNYLFVIVMNIWLRRKVLNTWAA
ncbi:MAG: MATE family efflux transporter [Erysipelotrichaceae bacterium]|nr:MATE family efflux transporter [Erysipelotrichaceae bacterium]